MKRQDPSPTDRQPVVFSLLGLAVFVFAGASVFDAAGPVGLDADALLGAAAARSDLATDFMLTMTRIGRGPVTAIVVASLVFLLWRRDRGAALFLAAANLGSLILSSGFKALFARPRPALIERITDPQSFSFPSGHALSAMVFYTSLAIVVGLRMPSWRAPLAAIAAFMIATIGVSRIYLGVHYPTDVLGGYGLGAAWIWMLYAIAATKLTRPE